MTYFLEVFGCAANRADAERIASTYEASGMKKADSVDTADVVVLVSCMIRQSAEDRIYGTERNIRKQKAQGRKVRLIVTGCMAGLIAREPDSKLSKQIKKKLPAVDEFLPVGEVGFETVPLRSTPQHALIPISNGCNNFCTYCIVPFTRGREKSRPFDDIVQECEVAVKNGFTRITLIGQNVNSYGSDIVGSQKDVKDSEGNILKPVYVKHLGRLRIPTLFPALLERVAHIEGVKEVDFISSNPWDFSDELIGVIRDNKVISRIIHLPVQSGDEEVLKRMNRWYTPSEYLTLIEKIRQVVPEVRFSTDIIVGFPGETEEQFKNTVKLASEVGFAKAYISIYSVRPGTAAQKTMGDDIVHAEKKRRWVMLDDMINKANLKAGTYPQEKP